MFSAALHDATARLCVFHSDSPPAVQQAPGNLRDPACMTSWDLGSILGLQGCTHRLQSGVFCRLPPKESGLTS